MLPNFMSKGKVSWFTDLREIRSLVKHLIYLKIGICENHIHQAKFSTFGKDRILLTYSKLEMTNKKMLFEYGAFCISSF
jgi:hypothetical protein